MAKVRVATFNCENLFARFRFNSNVNPQNASANGFTINYLAFAFLNEDEKKLTGSAIRAADADILCLQEIENFDVLKRFRSQRLSQEGYKHGVVIDGNDPRQIDVAVLSRFPIVATRSHQHLRSGNTALFSRDCLEVDIDVNGKPLMLFVNHLKSMLDKNDPDNGRKNTRARRLTQAQMVKQIVIDRFGSNPGGKPFVILGDLNDYLGPGQGTTDAISDLVQWNQVENVLERLPDNSSGQLGERWTHFFDQTNALNQELEAYKQIDYLLVSKSLAQNSSGNPVLVRKGLPRRAVLYSGPRFPGVGNSKPSASDHCPLAFDLTL